MKLCPATTAPAQARGRCKHGGAEGHGGHSKNCVLRAYSVPSVLICIARHSQSPPHSLRPQRAMAARSGPRSQRNMKAAASCAATPKATSNTNE